MTFICLEFRAKTLSITNMKEMEVKVKTEMHDVSLTPFLSGQVLTFVDETALKVISLDKRCCLTMSFHFNVIPFFIDIGFQRYT